MEDNTVLRSVATGLQSAEEGFLSTEDLDGGGGALGEVDQRTAVRDKSSTDDLADEGREVGSDAVHARLEVVEEILAVFAQLHHPTRDTWNEHRERFIMVMKERLTEHHKIHTCWRRDSR